MNNTKEKLKVPELVDKAEALLKERGYKDSLLLYRRYWNRFISFCETKNYLYFTENIGNEFLEEQKLTPTHYHTLPKGSTLKMIIRSIRILGDYQLHGTILRITKPSKAIPNFGNFNDAYNEHSYKLCTCQSCQFRLLFNLGILTVRQFEFNTLISHTHTFTYLSISRFFVCFSLCLAFSTASHTTSVIIS